LYLVLFDIEEDPEDEIGNKNDKIRNEIDEQVKNIDGYGKYFHRFVGVNSKNGFRHKFGCNQNDDR